MLSATTTHHRGIAGGNPLCPAALLRFRLHFTPCRGKNQAIHQGAARCSSRSSAASFGSMGTACRQTEEYKERRPRWRVFGRCRGIRASRPPGGDVRAGACALISIQEKIRRRRADSNRGGARKRPASVAVVRGHPEGKRRREPTRSKGPGICRKAGPGVNGREADFPPPSRSVLPAVPATQTVKPAACQDPLCP